LPKLTLGHLRCTIKHEFWGIDAGRIACRSLSASSITSRFFT
jgi:hypothetical protein